MSYWQTEHFKALQKAWYQRLKCAGFVDAEEVVGGDLVLRQVAAHPLQEPQVIRDVKEEYFRCLSQRAAVGPYKSLVDRMIMELFAGGKRLKEIQGFLASCDHGRSRITIRTTIRRYEMAWGLRFYTKRQLNNYYVRKTKDAS